MKTEELQIGNFVMLGDNIYKIDEISAIGWIIISEIKTNMRLTTSDDIINRVRPIPLTEEFFEKNGFKFLTEDEKYKTLCLNEPYINCTFVKEFKDWMITAGAAGSLKKRFVEVSKVQFVHQFQQLLRLCGYEMDVIV